MQEDKVNNHQLFQTKVLMEAENLNKIEKHLIDQASLLHGNSQTQDRKNQWSLKNLKRKDKDENVSWSGKCEDK